MLCRRQGVVLTKHHLIPRTRHKNKRIKRLFTRDEMLLNVMMVCRPCHSQIHNVLTEKELALEYNTYEKIVQHADIQHFVNWIKNKPANFRVPNQRKK